MESLLEQLGKISELLEQISAITSNQTTVLLASNGLDEEVEALDMMESMVTYKEEIIKELEEAERSFDASYKLNRGLIKGEENIAYFKEKVGNVLAQKKAIMELEQNNLMIMQSKQRQSRKKMELPKKAEDVAAAYKKHQKKS